MSSFTQIGRLHRVQQCISSLSNVQFLSKAPKSLICYCFFSSRVQCQPNQPRSWSITRYHSDLAQSIQLLSKSNYPVINRPNDVLIKVFASSINPLDIAMARGYGQVALTLANIGISSGIDRITYDRLPLSLGRDFVGEIVALGNSVHKFAPGQLVWGTIPPYYEEGAHANHVITSDDTIWSAPRNLSHVEAASMPYVGLTAWSALATFGGIDSNKNFATNKRCLILGAAGGVGCFATQLAKHWNMEVFATCSKQSMPWLESLVPNLNHLIDYDNLALFLRDFNGTFDLILDASTPEASQKNYQLMSAWHDSSKQSSVVPYITLTSPLLTNLDNHGTVSGLAKTALDALWDTFDGLRHGFSVRWAYYMPSQNALARITEMVEQGAIRPFTGKVFPFEQGLQAYQFADNKPNVNGKVVIDFKV